MDANDISGIEPVVLETGLSGIFEEHTSDQQGIDWHRLHQRREDYRAERLAQYRNYTNVIEPRLARYKNLRLFHEGELGSELTDRPMDASLYRFYRNFPQVHSNIVHFQLRNLIWSTSCHDLYVVCGNCIRHWNMLTGRNRVVLDLTGKQQHGGQGSRYMGVVHISTSCVKNGLAAAGGFSGEIVLASVSGQYHWGMRVSNSDNCITNGLELAEGHSGASLLIAANNDNRVRVLDVETKHQRCSIDLPWASNGASMCPTRRSMIAVVGDDQDVHLHDMSSCRPVLSLKGHLDWSFAVSWHPNGNLLATGNQDCTTRIWDVRSPGKALDVLPSEMGSVRSCRFSPDGLSLAVSEPVDFVHVYDVKNGMARGQDINFFGEISGIAFSPSSSSLFIGIPDPMYNSVLCYHKDSQDDS